MATPGKGVKRKLDVKTVEFKLLALLEVEKGEKSKSEIARNLDISTSTLSTWIKNAASIKEGYLNFGPKRKAMKTGKWDELESALMKWYNSEKEQGTIVTGPIMMQKANTFATSLGISDFEAKSGWLTRFKDRNNISFRSVSGKVKSVKESPDSMEDWSTRWKMIFKVYGSDNVYNADETGLFYKMLPEQTLEFKHMDCSGGKRSKERVTVMVAANMSGTDKLPLLVIGKWAKPRCFKHVQTLPTKYTNNSKALMTSDIFNEWILDVDMDMRRHKRKIAVIVDNCPAHTSVKGLTNVKLVFLQQNTNCKTQPMDQGVIQNLKVHYRKRVVLKQVQTMDAEDKDKDISLLDALRYIQQSWQCVTQQTISNCFHRAGFQPQTPVAVISEDDDELDDKLLARLAISGNSTAINEFIGFNEDVVTSEHVTDDVIINDIITARCQKIDNKDDGDDGDDDDEKQFVRQPPTDDQALASLALLSDYFESKDNANIELDIVGMLTTKIMQAKVLTMDNE